MKSIALWTAALALVGAASAGFAPDSITYATPYATPVVEKPSADDAGTFDGLLSLAQSLPPSSSLKVLWTHGMSLSDYLLQQIRTIAERPTIEEMRARLARRSPVTLSVDTADAVRAERDSR